MIYFRGCVAREKLNNIADATEKILKHTGIDYKLLENETCCGSFLLRTGFVSDAKEVMKNTLKEIGEEKIITSCAGCYKTFKKDYKEILGVELDVVHTSQLFNGLIKKGKLKPLFLDKIVTYHDPCHLGRHLGEYNAPREILDNISNLVEMERNKEKSRCCGAGGGVRAAFPEITENIAKMRIKDAEDVEAEILVTSCPFCLLNLKSASKDDKKVLDLSEIIMFK
ncbi:MULTISPECIES: (Fe-S)-binding protein [Methanobacterium]|uniref:Fumarate reductase n=1 Tax=Methanobacterium bryantii TaxID=2161 RepID=A0A2A2H3J7_METBR|nr:MULTISPECIES: (Fe-S)-binding protein [Methanobacterium]OEC86118.1 fumarate reductase [Methanobacterium sp. A39]PAV03894.1 fumarate reductase [Methanobacterium bryantii]